MIRCKCGETRTLMIVGCENGWIGYNYDSVPQGNKVQCVSCKRRWIK